ncbi:MAG TPA: HlyD family secretion protein [Pararhizobium sp.]|nr:HlyD family secretion protein [Pararhizobium sp.]
MEERHSHDESEAAEPAADGSTPGREHTRKADATRAERHSDGGSDQTAPSGETVREPPEDDKPKKRKSIFRRPLFWLFVIVAIIAIIGGFFYYWFDIRPYVSTDDAFIGADVVQISPQISGRIVADPADNNSHVSPGDLLARIDPADAQAALARAKAQLEQAKAQLQQTQAGVEQAKNQEAEAEAKAQALAVTAKNAEDTLHRDQQLMKSASSAITRKQVDNDRAAARSAAAQAEAGKRAVVTAKSAINVAKAQVTAAQAAVTAAEAQVKTAQITLDHTTISAPLAGQIVQKNINVGSYVTPGQAMMALVPDKLYVTANFKETQLADIHVGQPVDIKVDAYPNVHFHGKVVSIQHGAGQAFQLLPPQNATGNFVKVVQRVPVRISIDAKDLAKYPLGPGMSVVPSIKVN